jgi:hypothetical protein
MYKYCILVAIIEKNFFYVPTFFSLIIVLETVVNWSFCLFQFCHLGYFMTSSDSTFSAELFYFVLWFLKNVDCQPFFFFLCLCHFVYKFQLTLSSRSKNDLIFTLPSCFCQFVLVLALDTNLFFFYLFRWMRRSVLNRSLTPIKFILVSTKDVTKLFVS